MWRGKDDEWRGPSGTECSMTNSPQTERELLHCPDFPAAASATTRECWHWTTWRSGASPAHTRSRARQPGPHQHTLWGEQYRVKHHEINKHGV